MPVRITLRTKKEFSPFRVLLKKLIELPDGDTVILCSGFIQEVDTQKQPKAYNISDDELINSLKIGCKNGKVITIAGKLRTIWGEKYKLFISHLRASGLQLKALSAPKKNWHAKIAIKLKEGEPIAALIGSSNLTRPAYGIELNNFRFNLFKDWNFEGDVLIWENSQYNNYFKEDIEPQRGIGDMILILDPETKQPKESDQLRNIYKFILEEVEHFDLE